MKVHAFLTDAIYISIVFFIFCYHFDVTEGIFRSKQEWLNDVKTTQRHYGIAASDVDDDGHIDWIVAGFDGPNFVLKYDVKAKRLINIAARNSPYAAIMDEAGQAIGISACDIDGDGKEEIYVLNTNNGFAGLSSYSDKLFKWRNGSYVDLYSDPVNSNITAKNYAGRSVACIDRAGTGRYSFIITAYANDKHAKFAMIEMDLYHRQNYARTGNIVLVDVAEQVGIAQATGGRGVVVGPILGNNGRSDIFFGNENSPWLKLSGDNFLFKNLGNGSFADVAVKLNLADGFSNARGVALGDFDENGWLDIVVGNWNGHHRLYLQDKDSGKFRNVANVQFDNPSLVRTVMVADFNNDGLTDIFFNHFCSRDGGPTHNRLTTIKKFGKEIRQNVGDAGMADEPYGCGTGGSYADMDEDGTLDMILSHADSFADPATAPLTVFRASTTNRNRWLRVAPKTVYGGPARGALVTIGFSNGRKLSQVIDGGSGYLCQMEPVAHFGLGLSLPNSLFIRWPDGRTYNRRLNRLDLNEVHVIDWGWSVITARGNPIV
ncbi:cartilage acidic protein 1-like [Mizuhopecten yessoensis]|uniref:Cartilage acidic protein 1 n=1 Tax=Mizuhopecten yessoensis TaxID=6573 RepID=A0A210QMT5_MIZYE|nr:cartilage acidic protein 1-like [Mizuhopecten yessoensis]OWF50042.1 Cartilage acidic protein 1 [Mizuhopecten yessoensis]